MIKNLINQLNYFKVYEKDSNVAGFGWRIFCRYGAAKTCSCGTFGVIQVQDKYQVITNPFWSNWFFL